MRSPAALLLAAAAVAPASAQMVGYELDPQHSFVHFEVLHFDTSTVRGRFGPVEGVVGLDRGAGRGTVSLRIPVASVDTGLRVFDARLRESDLLAAAAYPEAFFVAQDFRFEGDSLAAVRGVLTLRGVDKALTLRAQRFACRDDAARGREVCGGDFETEIRRSEFGADFGSPWVADRVRLIVQVEGVRR
jgi:polyisoprenoid-binding protein YceI